MFQILSHDGQTYSNYYSSPASLIIFDLDTLTKSAGEGVNLFGVIIQLSSAKTELGKNIGVITN